MTAPSVIIPGSIVLPQTVTVITIKAEARGDPKPRDDCRARTCACRPRGANLLQEVSVRRGAAGHRGAKEGKSFIHSANIRGAPMMCRTVYRASRWREKGTDAVLSSWSLGSEGQADGALGVSASSDGGRGGVRSAGPTLSSTEGLPGDEEKEGVRPKVTGGGEGRREREQATMAAQTGGPRGSCRALRGSCCRGPGRSLCRQTECSGL